jgi:WD40 repeat protein
MLALRLTDHAAPRVRPVEFVRNRRPARGLDVATLRLQPAASETGNHGGEVFACAFTPDSAFVLSGGWDGQLRLWEVEGGSQVAALRASDKPVSACAVTPDGKQWLSGSLDGLLAHWDTTTRQRVSAFVPNGRPLSAIVYTNDGRTLATASWDGNVSLWGATRDRDGGRMLTGHTDIVSGCRFTPCGQQLVSWSYDRTVRVWDATRAREVATLTGHGDRILAGAVSPDGKWAVTGDREGRLQLWDLPAQAAAGSLKLPAEVRGCFFLLDGQTLGVADAQGRLTLHAVPDLSERAELFTHVPVQCVKLAPSGDRVALGCDTGHVRLVGLDGFDDAPLPVTARQKTRRTATTLQRLFGRSSVTYAYSSTCPACRQVVELPGGDKDRTSPCPYCGRPLRVSSVVPEAVPT